MERKPEWKTKEERIQGCRLPRQPPLSPTKRSHSSLPRERNIPKRQERRRSKPFPSCQKNPSFPTAENKNVSLSLLLKKPIAEVQKDSPPSCQKPCIIFPTAKRTPFPAAEKTTSLSPPLKTKQPTDDKPIHTLPRHDRGA